MTRPRITQQRFAVIARQMYDDPELTGDVLHFALALAELLTREKRPDGKRWTVLIAEHVGARYSDWSRWAIAKDVPRHEPIDTDAGYHSCAGQMIRRPGLCGRNSTQRHWLHNAITGEITVVASCNRHHDQLNAAAHASSLAWIAAGKRPGPQNAGGQLEGYFKADWDSLYAWARPGWKRPGTAIEPPRRPQLTLIHGGLELVDEG